ncbi:DUF4202 domain-containing protein [Fulvivirga sp. M361]|uniref:DUF4202 domain-containing protein n=1 Tax=Fulvivirga sp. M361 TaxID=2594266 RepID=UPI00117A4481|nr:DUF4202 domain-containing protein [Fulvivirga sp. M361]TRX59010.1 DUF4202 domain-containing protein [Fulvivirga sp. M361]
MVNKFNLVIDEIDVINSHDPNSEYVIRKKIPAALIYGHRMTETLYQLDPEPDELLVIAARGQHIKRWSIPRSSYTADRKGYLKWRTELMMMHARTVKEIMLRNDYTPEEAEKTSDLILKKKMKQDPEAQLLEDVVCLVFLQHYFEDFIEKHKEEKVVSILQKTWGKMSRKGQETALKLNLSPKASNLVAQALA